MPVVSLSKTIELADLSDQSQSFRRMPSVANHQEHIRYLIEHNTNKGIKMASGKKITIDDMSIYYESHGSGPQVVLLIHGAVGKLYDTNSRDTVMPMRFKSN